MLFNSFEFWAFFALVLMGLYLLPRRGINVFLLLASYAFYGAWDARFLSLLWISTVVDYIVGIRLHASEDPGVRKRWLLVSLATNLGILGFFKYVGFFSASLQTLLEPTGARLAPWAIEVVLPVGISFYTFQTLSYTIDIYRRQLVPTRSLIDFGLYVSFFPQLVAGPIERATHLLPQIQRQRRATTNDIASGTWLSLWGLFKKVVIADNLAPLVDAVYAPGVSATGAEVLFATYAFTFQIYCDFSGYTDIARGIARIMGFDLMRNFDVPYFSASIGEYWRRWHISLSNWLRDYLYIPLGGNRGTTFRTVSNLMITMVLGGLWHGAAWTFVVWGAFHGALLGLERALQPLGLRVRKAWPSGAYLRKAAAIFVTFHLLCFGFVIFRAESLAHAGALLSQLVGPFHAVSVAQWVRPLAMLLGPLMLMELIQWKTDEPEIVLRWPFLARAVLYTGLLLAIVLLGEDGGTPFIYFQF
ncbi:MAG: MBOAT family protein [Candidatus Binatia bacterium]|nr:MBOAT family protein [Candidatus Binatia bacterium]